MAEKKKIGAIPTFDQKTITFTTKTKNNDKLQNKLFYKQWC